MITLLHGEDFSQTQKELDLLKNSFPQGSVLTLDPAKQTPEQIYQSLTSSGLFSTTSAIIVENPENLEKISSSLAQVGSDVALILVSQKKLPVKEIAILQKLFPTLVVKEFRPPTYVFAFLQSISPGGQRKFLDSWQKYRQSESEELIFTMIVRQFRLLLLAKSLGPNDSVPEWSALSPWQKNRLLSQARLFSPKKLEEFYRQLAETEHRQKSGRSSLSLVDSLELLLLTL